MSGSAADRVRVVLVDPSEPGNVGATARAMRNTGFSRLVLVPGRTPADALLSGDARRMAAGADAVLDDADVAPSLPAALADVSYALATTARDRSNRVLHALDALGELVAPRLQEDGLLAIVFGPEDRGLANEDLMLCQDALTIPTSSDHTSLNLAQAVLLVLYRLGESLGSLRSLPAAGPLPGCATGEEREAMYRQMRSVLLDIGFLNADAPEHIEAELRALVDRARPTSREITLLRGIWSQVAWATGRARRD